MKLYEKMKLVKKLEAAILLEKVDIFIANDGTVNFCALTEKATAAPKPFLRR